MPKVVDADEQRWRVIDAAWNVILEDGLDGATMRRIAARAGCTTGLVTHYFASKEDLVLKMVKYSANLAGERITRALAGRQGLDALRALLIESTPISKHHADEWRIWVALWDRAMFNERLRYEWNRRSEGWEGLVRDGLRQAIEVGELSPRTPVEPLVEALAAFHYGLSLSAVMTPERSSASRIVEILDQQLAYIKSAYPGKVLRAGDGRARAKTSA